MPLYRFMPASQMTQAASSSDRHEAVSMVYGAEYVLGEGWAEYINRIVAGFDGQPALRLIRQTHKSGTPIPGSGPRDQPEVFPKPPLPGEGPGDPGPMVVLPKPRKTRRPKG